jgi:hypothetical protein
MECADTWAEAMQVLILKYVAGSVGVSNVVYFQPWQRAERDAFAQLLATNPWAAVDRMNTSYGLVTASVDQDVVPPLSPIYSPPLSESSAPDAGGGVAPSLVAAAGAAAVALTLAVLVGWWLYRRAGPTAAVVSKKPDTVVEVMTAGKLLSEDNVQDSAQDWARVRGQVQAPDEAASSGIFLEATDVCEADPGQWWVAARRTLQGTHQLEWSELEMTKQIGSGSYGQVFLGRWRADEVAIKVVALEGRTSQANTAAFIHEVRVVVTHAISSRKGLSDRCDVCARRERRASALTTTRCHAFSPALRAG